jgi:hypothetical protein
LRKRSGWIAGDGLAKSSRFFRYAYRYPAGALTALAVLIRAQIMTTDFMLGWGRMSDESVLSHIEISQSNRFGFWRVQEFPIPQREIETSAANMHLIAADRTVANQLERVWRGQVVHMRGYLVRADASDGWHWISSLSREDTGAGACEVFLVEQIGN